MEQNKTGRYLKYAIGEIILVVIGILIAVGINSKYNDVQNDKKIQAILKRVQNELITDIKDAHRIFRTYIDTDTLSRHILDDSLKLETFMDNPRTVLFRNYYVSFSNKKNGYERFMQNLENLPEKYNILLPHFNYLFREEQNEIDDYNEEIKETVMEGGKEVLRTKPWVYEIARGNLSEQNAEKILADPFLKNSIVKYINDMGNIARAANNYRATSIDLYKLIDSLLGQTPTDYPDYLHIVPPTDSLRPFIGNYTRISAPHDGYSEHISIKLENGQLLLMDSNQKTRLFWDSQNYFYAPELKFIFHFIQNEKAEPHLEISNGAKFNLYQLSNMKSIEE